MGCSESTEVKHPPTAKPVAPAKPAEKPAHQVDPNVAAQQQMMMQ